MSCWRLLAELPAFEPTVALTEETRPLVLGTPKVVGRVILNDPAIPPGHNWLNVFEVTEGEHPLFLSWISESRPATSRYYVPAPAGKGFSSESPLYEGHWRLSIDRSDTLPWPESEPEWRERDAYLVQLDRVEALATRIVYRGISLCRLCGQKNGHEAFRLGRWEWPSGYRHYIAEHDVRPSQNFIDFIAHAP